MMPAWLEASLFWVVQVVMLVGLFGLVVPVFPGLVVIWLGGLGYGVAQGFSTLGWVIFAILTVIMLAGTVVDNLLMGAGARQGGAAWSSILLALAAGVVGTIAFPPLGGLIAAPLAVFALEYLRHRDGGKAWSAVRGLALGWGLTFLVRFAMGLVMMALWWIWVWKG
ncbi:MAG: DUF456 domain-containing protein [Chloroflexota bacterium]